MEWDLWSLANPMWFSYYYLILIALQYNRISEELEMMNWRLLKYWWSASTMYLQPLDLLNKQMGESKKYPSIIWISSMAWNKTQNKWKFLHILWLLKFY